MSSNSNIAWTDATWNPVVGCSPVSEGCRYCYAAAMTKRLESMWQEKYYSLIDESGTFAVFNGTVRCCTDALGEPFRWRKPRRVFVCSMSDLFHPDVPTEFIRKIFGVMRRCPQHLFQVLTKRPDRMAKEVDSYLGAEMPTLPNVWLGTSIEDEATADLRIGHLRRCHAPLRFLSCEPLLGPIDLPLDGIGWVIIGCESRGTYLGRLSVDRTATREDWLGWAASIVQKCQNTRIPVFVKQIPIGKRVAKPKSDIRATAYPIGWPTVLRANETPATGKKLK